MHFMRAYGDNIDMTRQTIRIGHANHETVRKQVEANTEETQQKMYVSLIDTINDLSMNRPTITRRLSSDTTDSTSANMNIFQETDKVEYIYKKEVDGIGFLSQGSVTKHELYNCFFFYGNREGSRFVFVLGFHAC